MSEQMTLQDAMIVVSILHPKYHGPGLTMTENALFKKASKIVRKEYERIEKENPSD